MYKKSLWKNLPVHNLSINFCPGQYCKGGIRELNGCHLRRSGVSGGLEICAFSLRRMTGQRAAWAEPMKLWVSVPLLDFKVPQEVNRKLRLRDILNFTLKQWLNCSGALRALVIYDGQPMDFYDLRNRIMENEMFLFACFCVRNHTLHYSMNFFVF